MAAEITVRENGFAEIAYTGNTPWHKLGNKVDGAMTSAEAIVKAGLDWEVLKRPIYTDTGTHVTDYYATLRADNEQVLGVVGAQYRVVQNQQAFTFMDDIVGEKLAMYEVAGSLKGGKRVWMLAKLPNQIVVADRDPINEYLLLCNSHDGSLAVTAMYTPIRVVCQNTLSVALNGKGKRFSTNHKVNVHSRLANAREILGLAENYFDKFATQAERLAKTPISGAQALEVFGHVYKISPVDLVDMMLAEKRPPEAQAIDYMLHLANYGTGNKEFAGTAWGLYNGVTEYFDHIVTGRGGDEGRLYQSAFARGSQVRQQVWNALATIAN